MKKKTITLITSCLLIDQTNLLVVAIDIARLEVYYILKPYCYIRLFIFYNSINKNSYVKDKRSSFIILKVINNILITVDESNCIKTWDITNLLTISKEIFQYETQVINNIHHHSQININNLTYTPLSQDQIINIFQSYTNQYGFEYIIPQELLQLDIHINTIKDIKVINTKGDDIKHNTFIISYGIDGYVYIHNIYNGLQVAEFRQGYAYLNILQPTAKHWQLKYNLLPFINYKAENIKYMIQQIKNSTIESIIKQFKNNNQQIKGGLIIAPNKLKEEEQNYNIFSNKPLQQKHHEKSLNRYKLMIKNDDIIQNHLKIKEEKIYNYYII